MNFVVRVLVSALALWVTSLVIPRRFDIVDNGTALGTVIAVVVVALIFNLVNSIIRPIVKVLSLPLYLLTLGLFSLVVNAAMLWLTTWITQHWFTHQHWGIAVHGGFWSYVLAALILAILQVIIGAFAPKRHR
ncbi:MAG: phage holin family protein [Promicromonosporaceae bacterium]|nr:phage holin family protein [Promicromonosporaceae bacterium]